LRKYPHFSTDDKMHNIDLLQRADHNPDQLISLHGSLFNICCENKACTFEDSNYTPEPTVPVLRIPSSNDSLEAAVAALSLRPADVPSCPRCRTSKIRPGICWFGEKLPRTELSRVEKWFQESAKVDLVLVIGTERTPFIEEAIAKGAEVAWLNVLDSELVDVGDDWYVSGCVTESLTQLVEAALW
jgi:NAD-dependent SIR2 family protein deacetylase